MSQVLVWLSGSAGPVDKLFWAVRTLLEGSLLGLVSPNDMDAIVRQTYRSKPEFYDPSRYRVDHETRVLPLLERFCPNGGRLLDAFCGQGREAEIFANAGFDVTGFDRESWMIDAARRNATTSGFGAQFSVANFDQFTCKTPYDVVYTSLWMYSTYQGRTRRIDFLKRCRELCLPDGLIVISTVGVSGETRAGRMLRFLLARWVGLLTCGNRQSEWGERFYSGLFWHHLTEEQVDAEVASAGLQVVERVGATGLDPEFFLLTHDSNGTEYWKK